MAYGVQDFVKVLHFSALGAYWVKYSITTIFAVEQNYTLRGGAKVWIRLNWSSIGVWKYGEKTVQINLKLKSTGNKSRTCVPSIT